MNEIKLTKLQENKFSMFKDLETVLDRNKVIVDRIPQLSDSTTKFKTVISDISLKAITKNTVLKGSVVTKSNKRIELESIVIESASALFALGAKKNNEMLKAIARVNQSSLDRIRDTDLINIATSILDSIISNADEMESFAFLSDDIEKLRNSIKDYNTSSTETSGSKTESKVINKSLKEIFQYGMQILNLEIDKMVDSLKSKEKNFYDSYYAVRSVKNLGIRHKKQANGEAPKVISS